MTKTNILKITAITLLGVIGWHLSLILSELLAGDPTWGRLVFGLSLSLFSVGLVVAFSRLDKTTLFSQPRRFDYIKLAGKGALWFAVPATAALVIAIGLNVVEVTAHGSPAMIIGSIMLVAALVALSEAIPEEVIFRGYVFSRLLQSGNLWLSVFGQAVLFTLLAFLVGALGSPLDLSFIFTFGLVLGVIRASQGSVAATIGFHLACMTFQQSFSSQWGIFEVSNGFMVQTYIFGMIPLSVAAAYLVTKLLNQQSAGQSSKS